MAKIKVMGDTVQICTALKMETIVKAKKFKPTSLWLLDENNEVYFAIGVGNAHYGKNGITFSSIDSEGKAFMTTSNPIIGDHTDKTKEETALTSEFAMLLNNLEKIETQVTEISKEISNMERDAKNNIEFFDKEFTKTGYDIKISREE